MLVTRTTGIPTQSFASRHGWTPPLTEESNTITRFQAELQGAANKPRNVLVTLEAPATVAP
eukprot:2036915-Pleurochrysis_carterae.AAC.1